MQQPAKMHRPFLIATDLIQARELLVIQGNLDVMPAVTHG